MTVAEEVGLEGANALDPALVTGSILVNLDSEEDGRLTVGCAGSTDTWVRIDAPREDAAPQAVALSVTVAGGKGGHSGSGIALGHSNAIKVLGRALREAHAKAPFRLVSLNGGKSRNAIPRDASAVISVEPGNEAALREALEAANDDDSRRILEDRRRCHGLGRARGVERAAVDGRRDDASARRDRTSCPRGRSR